MAASTTFDEFVKQRTARAKQSAEALNPDRTLRVWRRELKSLFGTMEQYLKGYIESDQIKMERRPVQITEERLGTYDAEELVLHIGNDEVIARPIGTLLIGSRGRVDLSGPRKTLRILLLEEGGPTLKISISGTDGPIETSSRSPWRGDVDHAGWYLVTPPPSATATALSEDSFRDAVMDVSGA